MIPFNIILLSVPAPTLPAVYDPILEQLKPDTITIIGETHKQQESAVFFKDLALAAIKRHQCVVIGLEIASDQQAKLDALMQGRAAVEDIQLWPEIDFPPYRQLLKSFAELKQQGHCLKVIAIDAATNNPIDRDLWMAMNLAGQGRDTTVLVLLGALHTLKRISWKFPRGRPSVAGLLTARGFRVKTYPQRWLPRYCHTGQSRIGSFINAKYRQALNILNGSLQSLINARPYRSTNGVVDGFVVWRCGQLAVQ